MKYKQFIQESRKYEYGKGKEFETKEKAMKEVKKLESEVITQLALDNLYYLIKKREIIDNGNELVLCIKLKIPKIFD